MPSLRNLFGPSQDDVWQKVAEETGGELIKTGRWGQQKVTVRVKQWIITLDTYTMSDGQVSHSYTRMRAPYVSADNLRFTIYRSGFFAELAKKLGMQDIEIGDPEFDRNFIIKGNNAEKIRAMLSFPNLRELIARQPHMYFQVKDDEGRFGQDFPQGVDELFFYTGGVVKDPERLKSLFTLFAVTLNCLCHIGSACENDPQIRLQ